MTKHVVSKSWTLSNWSDGTKRSYAETELAKAAADLTAGGNTVDFSGRGLTTTLLADNAVSMLQFCLRGAVDVTNHVGHLVGGSHTGTGKWIRYNDVSASWQLAQSLGSAAIYVHGYAHLACDPDGNLYFRGYNSTNVYRAPIGSQFSAVYSVISSAASINVASALGYHEGRDALFFFDSADGANCRSASGSWSSFSSLSQDRYHTECTYQRKRHAMYFGGGTSGTLGSAQQVFTLSSSGTVTTKNNLPVPWGPAEASAAQAVMVADPGPGGEMLLIASNGNIYEHKYGSDSWSVIDTHPWFDQLVAAIPWPQYGVLMVVEEDATVTLYKR